jgi:hypothetical protein
MGFSVSSAIFDLHRGAQFVSGLEAAPDERDIVPLAAL